MIEASHRLHEQLQEYWNSIRGIQEAPHTLPNEANVNIAELGRSWKDCFLVQYLGADAPVETRFSYLYLGDALIKAYGDKLGSKDICERLVYPSNVTLNAAFERVIATAEPTHDEGEFMNASGLTIKYRSILLPLADYAGNLTYILGGMRWKSCL